MDVGKYLSIATETLTKAGIDTARLDVLVLLEDVLQKDRAILLAHPELPLSADTISLLNNFITQRIKHTPLAYIRGRMMFFGREFIVNTNVLVPRAETETMIELAKNTPLPSQSRIADIGTGSGCIGITIGLELPDATIYLYDIDDAAIEVATKNAHDHHISVHIQKQDLLKDCTEQFEMILTNLPYVPDDHPINQAATFEPRQALFSGKDGMNHYRIFWDQLNNMSVKPRYILTESMPNQHSHNKTLAREAGYVQDATEGFIQRFVRLSATEE